jgi:hypothetical protein
VFARCFALGVFDVTRLLWHIQMLSDAFLLFFVVFRGDEAFVIAALYRCIGDRILGAEFVCSRENSFFHNCVCFCFGRNRFHWDNGWCWQVASFEAALECARSHGHRDNGTFDVGTGNISCTLCFKIEQTIKAMWLLNLAYFKIGIVWWWSFFAFSFWLRMLLFPFNVWICEIVGGYYMELVWQTRA